jgi:hypothetical protein
MEYDFDDLERRASDFRDNRQIQQAIKIYLYMADGDQSLADGYLGHRLGQCYEAEEPS